VGSKLISAGDGKDSEVEGRGGGEGGDGGGAGQGGHPL